MSLDPIDPLDVASYIFPFLIFLSKSKGHYHPSKEF